MTCERESFVLRDLIYRYSTSSKKARRPTDFMAAGRFASWCLIWYECFQGMYLRYCRLQRCHRWNYLGAVGGQRILVESRWKMPFWRTMAVTQYTWTIPQECFESGLNSMEDEIIFRQLRGNASLRASLSRAASPSMNTENHLRRFEIVKNGLIASCHSGDIWIENSRRSKQSAVGCIQRSTDETVTTLIITPLVAYLWESW